MVDVNNMLEGAFAKQSEIVEREKLKLSAANAGIKHDLGKPDLSIVPAALENACARALEFGARKYGRNNYRKGIKYTRILAATFRHLRAWNEVSTGDPESGLSHLDHAIACLAMLAVQEEQPGLKEQFDDRDLNANSQAEESRRSDSVVAGHIQERPEHSSAGPRDDGLDPLGHDYLWRSDRTGRK